MLIYNGKLALTSVSDIKWHHVRGHAEIAYSFRADNSLDHYCVLANNLASIAVDETGMSDDLSEIESWITNSVQGNDITIDTLKESYGEDVTAFATLIVFDGECFYLDHATSFIYHVPKSMEKTLKQFYFGDPDFSQDTVTEQFYSKGICSLDGAYNFIEYSAQISQLKYDYSNFFFKSDGSIKGKYNQNIQVDTLYLGPKPLMSGIIQYSLTNDGFSFKGSAGGKFYALYDAADGSGGESAGPIDYKFGTFVLDQAFFLVQGNVSIKFPMCADKVTYDEEAHLRTLDLGDIKLEFAEATENTPYVHVVGYQRYYAGEPVRWGGQTFTNEELTDSGLDHDLTDPWNVKVSTTLPLDSSNRESTEMLEPIVADNKPASNDTVSEDSSSEKMETPKKMTLFEDDEQESKIPEVSQEKESFNEPDDTEQAADDSSNQKEAFDFVPSLLSKSQLDPTTLFRDVRVDQLYKILNDKTLVF